MKKIIFFPLLVVTLLLANQLSAQNTNYKNILPGSWLGRISTGGINLRLVFNLKLNEKDSLIATADSPDQGTKDIQMGQVILENDKLTIQAPSINGEYSGTFTSDSTIDGIWSQGGGTFTVNLKKLKTSLIISAEMGSQFFAMMTAGSEVHRVTMPRLLLPIWQLTQRLLLIF